MPASVALAVVVNALEAVGEHVAQHLVLAPGLSRRPVASAAAQLSRHR